MARKKADENQFTQYLIKENNITTIITNSIITQIQDGVFSSFSSSDVLLDLLLLLLDFFVTFLASVPPCSIICRTDCGICALWSIIIICTVYM